MIEIAHKFDNKFEEKLFEGFKRNLNDYLSCNPQGIAPVLQYVSEIVNQTIASAKIEQDQLADRAIRFSMKESHWKRHSLASLIPMALYHYPNADTQHANSPIEKNCFEIFVKRIQANKTITEDWILQIYKQRGLNWFRKIKEIQLDE